MFPDTSPGFVNCIMLNIGSSGYHFSDMNLSNAILTFTASNYVQIVSLLTIPHLYVQLYVSIEVQTISSILQWPTVSTRLSVHYSVHLPRCFSLVVERSLYRDSLLIVFNLMVRVPSNLLGLFYLKAVLFTIKIGIYDNIQIRSLLLIPRHYALLYISIEV